MPLPNLGAMRAVAHRLDSLGLKYPTSFPKTVGAAYARLVVRIECGARSDRWPVAEQRITP